LFDGWKTLVEKKKPEKAREINVLAPSYIISSISRNGEISITFSEKMMVPEFLDAAELNSKETVGSERKLVTLNELDVRRDVLDLQFISQGGQNTDPD